MSEETRVSTDQQSPTRVVGSYVYGIIRAGQRIPEGLEPIPRGDEVGGLGLVTHGDLAAVVSDVATDKPLGTRRDDMADLARRFIARFAAEEGKRIRGITAEASAMLAAYDWPGNVRQLENAVFRAVVLADHDELTVTEFPQVAAQVDGFDVRIPPIAAVQPAAPRLDREIVRVEVRDPNVLPLLDENGDVQTLEKLEADTIRFALGHYRGQMSAMARKLGIGRSTLYRKMKEYGLFGADAPEGDEEAA